MFWKAIIWEFHVNITIYLVLTLITSRESLVVNNKVTSHYGEHWQLRAKAEANIYIDFESWLQYQKELH